MNDTVKRRNFLFSSFVASLFLMTGFANTAENSKQPNIVLILVDDVGTGWIPPYADRLTPADVEPEIVASYSKKRNRSQPVNVGKHIEAARACMPTLSKLAAQGAVFDRAFATASLCAPSRAGLMTGSFQQRWGAFRNMDIEEHSIPEEKTVMAEPLKAVGYRCGMIGKWHIAEKDPAIIEQVWADQGGAGPIPGSKRHELVLKAKKEYGWQSSSKPGQHPLDQGFDYYFGYNSYDSKYYNATGLWENHERVPARPNGEFLTDLFNEKSCEFIESALKESKPFFLYYAPMTLHGGILPPPDHYSEPFDTGIKFSNEYAGHLLALDQGIEQILQTLTKYDQEKNTLFIFSCDNGCTLYNVPPYNAPHRGGKGTGWLGGINIPFVVWQPGVVKPEINREIISLADVMPTVLEAAGASIPKDIDGKSLLPFLKGEAEQGPRDHLVSSAIQSSRWSYCYEAEGEINNKDANDCPLYAFSIQGDRLLMHITAIKPGLYNALPKGLKERTLLFDLKADPQQRTDLHTKYPGNVSSMNRQIHEWLKMCREPLTSQQQDYRELLKETKYE
tara:strand:+ start:25434 stop:27119 length:1686 start_codon:yes stop_codon:yes gene_type:complete